MSYTDEHIVEAYSTLLERLNSDSRQALIERLTASMKTDSDREDAFYAAFGGFVSQKSAEDIMSDIKTHRRFTRKDVQF